MVDKTYDAKNVAIVALISFCTLLLITTIYFYSAVNTETKEIKVKVPIERINYNPENVKEWLLRIGITNAWVETDQERGLKADCFSSILFPDGSVLSYCKLRT